MPQFFKVNGTFVDAETMHRMRAEKETKKEAKVKEDVKTDAQKEVSESGSLEKPKKGGRKTTKK